MTTKSVTAEYLMGIRDGRETLRRCGASVASAELANLDATARLFAASNPVGQMLRGERDFWRNQIKVGV
jgi:hypothetical protein